MFANNVKKLLQQQGKKQKDLAEYVDVKPSTVSDWLNQGNSPKLEHLLRISEFLDTSIDWLMTGKDKKNNIINQIPQDNSLTVEEEMLVNFYREMDISGRRLAQKELKELWAEHKEPKSKLSTSEDELSAAFEAAN